MTRAILAACVALYCVAAHAAPPPVGSEQYDLLHPYAGWITGLKNPTTGEGCCSISDCRVVEYRTAADGSGYEAFISPKDYGEGPNKWLPVPASVVLHNANPTGFAVACWASWHTTDNGFFCFIPGGGV